MSFEISKEELYDIYIIKKNNIDYIANLYNVSKDMVKRKLKKFDIHKDRKDIYQQSKEKYFYTMEQRYGVKFPVQNNEIKDKIIDTKKKYSKEKKIEIEEKRKKTCKNKYNTEYVLQNKSIREKIKNTNQKKYGTDNPMKSFEVRKKQMDTCLKKYGVDNVFKLKEIQDKADETMFKRYGVKNSSQSKVLKHKQEDTCLEKYGNKYFCLVDKCRKANGVTISKTNKNFSELLVKNNIKNKLEFNLKKYSYDIKILNSNVLLEINPTYTHNVTIPCWFNNHTKKILDKNYHLNKTINAQENGYRCIHIFDWEDKEKIINILKDKERIFARKCKIKLVDIQEANEFLNKYHLQNTCKGQEIILGLYYNNELVELMSFGKPRYNNKYEWELLRLCSKANIIGGTKKLFNNFIKKYNPHSIISYCDNSKFSGEIYNKLGFKLLDYGKPGKHWYNIKTKKHITDNLLRQRGYDQLFGTNYGKGTSNEELMIKNGFVELYDCGQSVYIYE